MEESQDLIVGERIELVDRSEHVDKLLKTFAEQLKLTCHPIQGYD